jgi:hypothetical protein
LSDSFQARHGSARLGSALLGSVLLGSALLGTGRRKHGFVFCCVIAGALFDVTVLAWRKYATICSIREYFLYKPVHVLILGT